MKEIRNIIEAAWNDRALLKEEITIKTIRQIIDLLDKGELRVAEPIADGWQVNEWVKKQWCCIFQFKKWKLLKLEFLNIMIKFH